MDGREYEKIYSFKSYSPFKLDLDKEISFYTSFKPQWHEQLEIKLILEGRIHVVSDFGVATGEVGDIIVTNPMETHYSRVEDRQSARYHILMVDLSERYMGYLYGLYFRPLIEREYRFENLIRRKETKSLFLQLVNMLDSDEPEKEMAASVLFLRFFMELLRNEKVMMKKKRTGTKNGLQSDIRVTDAITYMYRHMAEPIQIAKLASDCYMSEAHFCRIFKSVTGKTPSQFLIDYRLERASYLLINTTASIKAVAEQCGFNDVSYFCRCFKKHYGMPASKYHEINQKQE